MRNKFTLNSEPVRERIIEYIRRLPMPHVITVREGEARNLDQNAKLHAMLDDISSQLDWHGAKYPVIVWKRLTTAAWLRERGGKPMMIPALDGYGVDLIFEHTSDLSRREMAELIDWVDAFGTQNGVKWSVDK